MENIEEEMEKIEYELSILNNKKETNEEEDIKEIKEEPVKKKRGQTRERMMELHKIRSEKARLKREEREELKNKKEEVNNIKKEKINIEYEEAQKIKEALEQKKATKKAPEIKQEERIYKTISRDILKDKYLEETKRRVMMDLFS